MNIPASPKPSLVSAFSPAGGDLLRVGSSRRGFLQTGLAGLAGMSLPAFDLLEQLAAKVRLPVICEGGIATPEDVRRAFDCGAFAVVVGTAITGITQLVKKFVTASPRGQ